MSKLRLFFECFFKWQPDVVAEEDYDVIFCQSFGPRVDSPGISNMSLAKIVLRAYDQHHKQLIIQKDCADAIAELSDIKINKIISEHQVHGKYLDSYEVSRQCAQYCRENNFQKILVIAHPDHIWRVAKTIEKFDLIPVLADTRGVSYDRKSVQIWTRSRFIFLPREILSRLLYLFTDRI